MTKGCTYALKCFLKMLEIKLFLPQRLLDIESKHNLCFKDFLVYKRTIDKVDTHEERIKVFFSEVKGSNSKSKKNLDNFEE